MNLFSWIRRRKKKKEKKTTIFGEEIVEEKGSSFKIRKTLSQTLSFLRPKRKFRFKFLLKIKRIFAGCLFIMYFLASIMLLPEVYSLLFFGTAFILLDYLWKTKSIQWTKQAD